MSFLNLVGFTALVSLGVTFMYIVLGFVLSKIPSGISLDGKAVVITGCDTGIGRALAIGLASKHGVKVFAACLTRAGAADLSQETKKGILTFELDVTNDSSVAVAVDFVERHLEGSPLFAVINNAGVNRGFFIEFTDITDYQQVMDVNFMGLVRVTKAFLPFILKARGRIVNIVSCGALTAAPASSAYCASKFATAAFSDCLRKELQSYGVKVIQVAPGFVKTAMTEPDSSVDKIKDAFYRQDPGVQKRYGGDAWINRKAYGNRKFLKKMCSDPNMVLAPMVEALSCRYPEVRYLCGQDAYMMWKPISLLPARLQDIMFRRVAS